MSKKNMCPPKGGSAIYGVGGMGAFIYYMQGVTTASGVVIGSLKAIVWPAFLVYELLTSLGA